MADLLASGFRYWALGHIHKRSASEDVATVVMPGMPQGRDINESGPKSVTLATIKDNGSILLEERLTSIAQFERVTVDLADIEDWRQMVHRIGLTLGAARDNTDSEHLVARLHLTGATSLAWRIRQDPDLPRTEAENEAAGIKNTWIDKVEMSCHAPLRNPALTAFGDVTPLEELRRLMGQVTQDDVYRAEIVKMAEELRGQLPPDCRAILGSDENSFSSFVMRAADEGVDDILAQLKVASEEQS
jgi:DNA repair exonuclease SbcCD nuclease subunit